MKFAFILALAGHEQILAQHTYIHRAHLILKLLNLNA